MRADQLDRVDKWLRALLWDNELPGGNLPENFEIHRSKGRLIFEDGQIKMLQGVREIFELIDAPQNDGELPAEGKIIFIGRKLGDVDFVGSFKQAIG